MLTSRSLILAAGAVTIGLAGYLALTRSELNAQQNTQVKIKAGEIGGVVASTKGPEAGVWVIAETTDLPTRYIKEVVTDDRGRYLIPELPKAKYTVWARGYGLVLMGQLNFVVKGAMIGGFALAAAPAQYRVSGVKTFIVSHEGVVYEKDLGPNTLKTFETMETYNPDKTWQETEDE